MAGPLTYFDRAHLDELDPVTRDLVVRRERAMGASYRLFYDHPVRFVRGSGTTLWDADGLDYLDAYNNVPSVGHAHPRVAAAIAEQAARLVTHTRYLDESVVAYAEDLLGELPPHLGNVVFTCTGSEANDLALRIAKHTTGGEGVIVTDNAYHGVTAEIAAISPSLGGTGSIAPWVRTVPAFGDLGSSVRSAVADLAAHGIRPAALIIDTILASDGIVSEITGLADAVTAVHEAGALFIADEVQPGFGRLGHGLWGVTRYAGVEPDLVTLGKPMGNGQPVAATVARRELFESFGREVRYFNTFGGTQVSIAAAQATLDVVRDEHLVDNARDVGAYLRDALEGLGLEVRGAGLYLGVVLDGVDETLRVVNGLRERRVLLAASGPANDVLKIRPPLVFSRADADRLTTELATVLDR